MRTTRALALGVWIAVLAPDVAAACATCLDSAWGTRGFAWPFVVLMLTPFAVALGLAGALAWGWARRSRPRATDR